MFWWVILGAVIVVAGLYTWNRARHPGRGSRSVDQALNTRGKDEGRGSAFFSN